MRGGSLIYVCNKTILSFTLVSMMSSSFLMAGCGSESLLAPPPTSIIITETKDISYAGFKRITVRVLISKESTEGSARQVADYIVKKKRAEISRFKGITIWGYYNPQARGAWEGFMAEWKSDEGLCFFSFREPT